MDLGIVQLRECFAIDSNAFIMVLELCEGETLDMRLKMHGPMPEKEAKSMIVQILSLGPEMAVTYFFLRLKDQEKQTFEDNSRKQEALVNV